MTLGKRKLTDVENAHKDYENPYKNIYKKEKGFMNNSRSRLFVGCRFLIYDDKNYVRFTPLK